MDDLYYVVGSGPSGVMCAQALLDQGASVTMLDAGVECEPDKVALAERLGRQSPEDWAPALVKQLQGPLQVDNAGLLVKLLYGSDFPYAHEEMKTLIQDNTL